MPSGGPEIARLGPTSFFSRAFSGTRSNGDARGNDRAQAVDKEQRRRSSWVPPPPALATQPLDRASSPPLPATPTRPSALRSDNAYSLASSSAPSTPPLSRTISFDNQPSLPRSSTSHSSLCAPSTSSARRASLFPPETVEQGAARRASTTSIRNGRPVSSVFPSRPVSVYSATGTTSASLRASGSGTSIHSCDVSASEDDSYAASARAPSEVGAAQMDALVDGLQRGTLSGAGIKDREPAQRRQQQRRRRREDSTALSEWGPLGGSRSRSAFTSRAHHSRETSSTSEASFAQLDACPTPAELAAPLFPPAGDAEYVDPDITGAPSMERQETLKAIVRPWMASVVVGATAPKTPREIVEAFRAGASPTSGRTTGEVGVEIAGGDPQRRVQTPPPRASLPNGEKTLPPGIRRLSLSPSPRPVRRPGAASPELPVQNGHARPSDTAPSPPPLLAYVPFPAAAASSLALPDPKTLSRAKSIEEIIAEHAPASAHKSPPTPPLSVPPSIPPSTATARAREQSNGTIDSLAGRSSPDSLAAELRRTGAAQSFFGLASDESFSPPDVRIIGGIIPAVDALLHDEASGVPASAPRTPRIASPRPAGGNDTLESEHELARLLKSPRLTRLFTLREPPNAGLTVSLADMGSPSGHPVLVFLGLGSVRYLVALYDELADALGLRLICIDRWGLGRTTDVPDAQRGFVEWSSVVAELVGPAHLDLGAFSILAHSAGAPYAVAAALHGELATRVSGALHLLAPWVSTSADSLAGMYRYLKYVPAGVLKTAQAAEWKVQAWRLGKPPALVHAPVGWDAKTGRLMNGEDFRRDDKRRSEVAGQGVRLLNEGSPTNTRKLAELYPEGALSKAGPAAVQNTPKSKGLKASLGGLFGSPGAPKRSPCNGDPLQASAPSSRSSLLLPSPSVRRASFFSGSSRSTPPPASGGSASTRALAPSGLPMPSRQSSIFSLSPSPSPRTPPPSRPMRRPSLAPSVASSYVPSTPGCAPPLPQRERLVSVATTRSTSTDGRQRRSTIPPAALIDGLLRASHAESLGGGTSDLLVLLERTSSTGERGMGFAYADVPHRVKVWYGERDDRISLASIRWLECELDRGVAGAGVKACTVRIVEGAAHGLMANSRVMLEVLESIADEWVRR